MNDFLEIAKMAGVILAGGYFIWRVEAQGKMNKSLIERFDEKHSLFLKNSEELLKKELEILDNRLKNKKKQIEDMEKNIALKYEQVRKDFENMKDNCSLKQNQCQTRMNNFIDIKSADEKYASKMELKLEFQKIDNKLDTLISYFKGKGGDGLPKFD